MPGDKPSDGKEERSDCEDRYFHIVQSIHDAILLVRAGDGVIQDINEAFEKLTGYRREEILEQTSEQLPCFPKPGFWARFFPDLEAKKEVREIETSLFHKGGTVVPVLISASRVVVGGEPCYLNIIRDITERKQVEDALQEKEQHVRQKLEAILSPEADIGKLELANIIDTQMIQSLMNDFHMLTHIPMAIVNLKGEVLVGVGWQDICMKFHRVHPETCRHCVESDTQLSAGLNQGEFRLYKCKNNMWDIATPLIVGGRHVGNIFSGQFFFKEEPLDYELFRAQARQYGFDEQAYMVALGAIQRLSRETVNTGMAFLMKLAHMLSQLGYSNIKLARSLTERNALMDSLQTSEERYRNLFNGVPAGIFRTTSEGHILDANPALIHILGYPDRETLLLTNAASIYTSQEDRGQWQAKADKEGMIHGFETRMQRPDGRIIWVRMSGRIVHNEKDGMTYNEGVMEDITERKQAEEALRKAQEDLIRKEKLAILGQLSGVVGHELRNPLGTMNNAVYFLKTVMTDADNTVTEYLDIIKHEIDNSRRIITDLLDFARTKTPQTSSIAVDELVMQVLGKCRIPENIDVPTDIPDTLPEVNVDPFQIGQVLRNLITNAVQAMPEGGVLRIAARQLPGVGDREDVIGEGTADFRSPISGFVEIIVSDTGEGISPENMEKLFQPLFTTKSKGIGLGLTICKNLVEANGGKIEVESRPGENTIFRVVLPVKKGYE